MMPTPEQYAESYQQLAGQLAHDGLLSATDTAAPLEMLDYRPPTDVGRFYRDGADPGKVQQAEDVITNWDWVLKQKRILWDIFTDIQALTGAQKTAIWNDLISGSPPKLALDEGPNAAAIFGLHWATATSSTTTGERLDAQQRLMAMYTQDNPRYLINPPFAPAITVPGHEDVP
jgi:hypothetical protein